MRGGWLRGYALLYLLFLYAPILLLPIFALNDSQIIAFPLQGFTTRWFEALIAVQALRDAVATSVFVAVVTAILSTVLATCAARASARYFFPGKAAALGLIMLPLVLPEIIVAVALLTVLLWVGIELSSWSVIAAHTLICTPFCVAILQSAFANLDPSLEEAAYDLGETPWSTFRLVTLPLVMPGIVASLLISFTISLDEFIIAFFLTGADPTLPVYLWGLMRFPSQLPVVMALGTILVLLSIVLLVIAEKFRRRGALRSGGTDHGGFL